MKYKIGQFLNAFETGSAQGNYGDISVFNDGPNNSKQYTIGKSQTTESGELKKLLQTYVDFNGKYANELKPYIARFNQKPFKSIYKDTVFEKLIKDAAKDPIMVKAQDVFFDKVYWEPAEKFFNDNGFTLPLSMLVIYDTAVHSGPALNSKKSMMYILRQRFPAKTPKAGGNEKEWITQYVNARHSWLANNNSRPVLKKTVYRTNTFKNLIKSGNWNLTGTIITGNGVKIGDTAPIASSVEGPVNITVPPIVNTSAPTQTFWEWVKSWFS